MENFVNDDFLFDLDKKSLDAKILELLKDGNGFSADDLGTYFYKDVIKGIVLSLESYQSDAERKKDQISQKNDISSIMGEHENLSKNDLCLLVDKEKSEKELKLRFELQNLHSVFYYNVARNFANTDLVSFHGHIKEAASKTGLKNNYMVAAYHLGVYVSKLLDEENKRLKNDTGVVREKKPC